MRSSRSLHSAGWSTSRSAGMIGLSPKSSKPSVAEPHTYGGFLITSPRALCRHSSSFDEDAPSPSHISMAFSILDARYRMSGVAVYGIAAASISSRLNSSQACSAMGGIEDTTHLILDQASRRVLSRRELIDGTFSWVSTQP